MKEYLEKLNAEQYQAATDVDGFNYILAGAGTGKTATLVARVAFMLDSGINPEEILLLTFTNKAAKEMKERVVKQVGIDGTRITACTFHSFCAAFLRSNAGLIGMKPNFVIMDSADAADMLSMAFQDFWNDAVEKGAIYDVKDFPNKNDIMTIYEAAVNNCVKYEDVIRLSPEMAVYEKELLGILATYNEYKKEKGLMDYEDLLFYTEYLLRTVESLRAKTDRKYRYISCDEYQDTNTVQDRILSHLSIDCPNLTVVGDDNQSIYAFRYANISNILGFEERHPGCKTVVLETNYRSSNEILNFANHMMSYAVEGKKKELKGLFNAEKPKLIVTDDCYSEADFIIEKIMERESALKDIAVICRSARQSFVLESKLNQADIPYNKYGGIKFLEKPVIKDILAFLRVCVNEKDEIALFRLTQLYPGLGKVFSKKVARKVSEEGFDAAVSMYAKRAFAIYIKEIQDILNKLRGMTLNEQLHHLIDGYYKDLVENKIKTMKTNESKKSELYASLKTSLFDAEALYGMAGKYRSTSRFLTDLALDATTEEQDSDDKLNITTIHSAKGLEYETVFLMDCVEQVTPKCPKGDPEDPEELRCMYVAVTRAKKQLFLMFPQFYNFRNIYGIISHFLDHQDVLDTLEVGMYDKGGF